MPTTEILLMVANALLFMCLSRMAWKSRVARHIAMRLMTDDMFYHEVRSELIQKNTESARLAWGRVRVSTVMQIPVTVPQDPQAAWVAALHTATRLRPPTSRGTLPEPAPSILEVPYSLWVTTWASKNTTWLPTVAMAREKTAASQDKNNRTSDSREIFGAGFTSRAMQ